MSTCSVVILLKEISKKYSAGTPAECYMTATVLCRNACVYLCCNPEVDIYGIYDKNDGRDERERPKLKYADQQFYLYPFFPILISSPKFSKAQKFRQVSQALFLFTSLVDFFSL